jgi:hypothetical protein
MNMSNADVQQRVTAIGLIPKIHANGMTYRNVGRSGLKASALGVGCFAFGGYTTQNFVQQVVDQALDLGINYFDTATTSSNTSTTSTCSY